MKKLLWACVPLYLIAIVTANVVTANHAPWVFTWLGQTWVVTYGTFFVAATFFLRDGVQLMIGRRGAYVCIGVALASTVVLSRHYHDLAWVTLASALAFAVSETTDTEIFTRLHSSLAARVAASGVAGGLLDSAIFAIIGLSPLTTNIVPWSALWTTIVAQIVVKCMSNALVAIPFISIRVAELEPA